MYRILVTVNIKMWRHPKYYKELRKLRNKLDQAISKPEPTGHARVRPDPGLKQQATSKPEPVQVQRASSAKRQASSPE